MLDEYKVATEFALPKSYREFIQIFGPGKLGSDFQIRAPGYRVTEESEADKLFNFEADLAAFNERIRQTEALAPDLLAEYYRREDVERISRCVYFAGTEMSEVIGWDPKHVTDAATSEYGIYIIFRERDHMTFLADSFTQFAFDVCLGTRYGELTSPSAEQHWIPPAVFRPIGRRAAW